MKPPQKETEIETESRQISNQNLSWFSEKRYLYSTKKKLHTTFTLKL